MSTLDDFLPEVLPYVSGCSELYAKNAVLNAAREFCRRTRYHKVFLPAVAVLANTPTYTFSGMPTDTEVAHLLWARLGVSTELEPADDDWLKSEYALDWEARTGTPRYFTLPDENTIRLVPYPTENLTDTLVMRVAVQPTEAATTISTVLYQRHKKIIAKGALAELMLTPGTPYYAAAQGTKYETEFATAIGDVAWRAFKGHTRARPRVRGHYF